MAKKKAAKKKAAKKKVAKKKIKGISRIDYPGSGIGWFARVTFEGKTHSKYFADASHGGTDKALDKAVKWRDSKEKSLGKPRTDRHLAGSQGRSSTGVPGVYKSKNSYVVAWSPLPGKLVREFVSIREHGDEGALKKAVALRRSREREVYGKAFASVPTTPVKKKAAKKKVAKKKAAPKKATKKKSAPKKAVKKKAAPKKVARKAAKKPAAKKAVRKPAKKKAAKKRRR